MMGTSFFDYIFIQVCIYFLHYIAPSCALYCISVLLLQPLPYRIPWPLELWAFAEALFLISYFARARVLQRAATHPEPFPLEKRKHLFTLCHDTIQDPEHYLSQWFRGASPAEIRRGNVKELYRWAFMSKQEITTDDDQELEEYVDRTEDLLKRELKPGYGNVTSLRVSIDRVQTLYRSLFWYSCIFVVDSITHIYLLWHSFEFYRLPVKRFFTVFPLRPLSLFSRQLSPARTLTYWYKPHRSTFRMPLLFIHGIGIGLYPYVDFLAEINEQKGQTESDEDIGVIAIEIMPVSFRITGAALPRQQMIQEIQQILKRHGWSKSILASHSYGSVVCSHLLHDEETASLFGPVILVDPVSILLHLPDVAYNFTCRKPKRANEHQLYYFASMDMGVAHTLGRRFFWQDNALWKHELEGRNVTVSLAGKDLIVDTESVGNYLADDEKSSGLKWKHQEWTGAGLDILWFPDLDHAQAFDSKKTRKVLIDVIRSYSEQACTQATTQSNFGSCR